MKAKTTVALDILKITRPTIGEVVTWMEQHLGKWEHVEVYCWFDSLFYIEVVDSRSDRFVLGGHYRFVLTVDLAKDRIFWNDCEEHNAHGNCMVRSPKWKGLERGLKAFPRSGFTGTGIGWRALR